MLHTWDESIGPRENLLHFLHAAVLHLPEELKQGIPRNTDKDSTEERIVMGDSLEHVISQPWQNIVEHMRMMKEQIEKEEAAFSKAHSCDTEDEHENDTGKPNDNYANRSKSPKKRRNARKSEKKNIFLRRSIRIANKENQLRRRSLRLKSRKSRS